MNKNFFYTIFLFSMLTAHVAAIAEKPEAKVTLANNPLKQDDFNSLPTYIKSNSLTLKSNDRIFVYTGNVEVKHGDMTLTCDTLEGKYSQDNKVELLTARNNVLVVKGETIKANSEKAIYESATEIVTLTENPELQQNGSVLTADSIKIYLNENRSTAEGAVRVKLVRTPEAGGQGSKGLLGELKK